MVCKCSLSALPVLTYEVYAALRFSKDCIFDSFLFENICYIDFVLCAWCDFMNMRTILLELFRGAFAGLSANRGRFGSWYEFEFVGN